MRCSSENKFASFSETEIDVQSEDLNGSSIVYAIHLNRPCASCGQEAASAELELTLDIDHTCDDPDPLDSANWTRDDIVWIVEGAKYSTYDDALAANDDRNDNIGAEWDAESEPEYNLDSSDAEEVDTMQNKDRHGKPITNYRYMKHLIGAHVTAHVTCERCNESFDVDGEDTLPASGFDDAGH